MGGRLSLLGGCSQDCTEVVGVMHGTPMEALGCAVSASARPGTGIPGRNHLQCLDCKAGLVPAGWAEGPLRPAWGCVDGDQQST